MEPTKQKGKTDIVVIDLDDEDGNNSVYNKLAPKTNKELTTSELASNIKKWVASNGMSQAFETMHAEGDKSKQIVPYGQSAVLVNRFPLQTSWQPSIQFERVVLQKKPEEQRMQDLVAANKAEKGAETQVFLSLPTERKRRSGPSLHVSEDATTAPKQRKRKSDTCPVPADLSLDLRQTDISSEPDLPIEEEEKPKNESDGLEEYWKDFSLAIESTKLDAVDETANEKEEGNGNMEGVDCNHDIRIHEDLGHVCRVCGMIVRRAESIIDYQWKKSFLARYPSARPLVVLPKGIVGTWKREIQQWQVQDIPLYDFYSVKAEKRVDQLEVLKSWEDKMSILFLGYKQFSTIISDDSGSKAAAACRERLLKVPNLLIMDEGHTPRNKKTDVLESLNRVETPRKVVLSGTLFQNHVEEVFNILNLVRPKFLKMESSLPIVRRLMSQVEMSGISSKGIDDSDFTKSVEKTLLNDADFKRKPHLIRGLRELTKDVLHYYKAAESDEEKRHETASKKEVISKLWFEWSEHCTIEDFKLGQVDIDDSGDELLDTNAMRQAIKALCRR
ncbi:unnamed protein product [Urochloa decumbens]|uniref:Helicase ATP-binding domain-containing protein n=1 Tax=Urochloa decumbens TaxID=240449 RepID=A0ABC9CAQ2_9POAL